MKTTIRLLAIVTVAIIGFVLSSKAEAVSPPPDGGYPGGNTAEGQDVLLSLTTGTYNTAAGLFSLRSDATGSFNTATGAGALFLNTGNQNTATGAGALFSNTTGFANTANGTLALFSNSLQPNIGGDNNTAMGTAALYSNTVGSSNTALGAGALYSNSADANTATGFQALYSNTAGQFNTANGFLALSTNTLGSFNTAVGYKALENNTGDSITAIGDEALNFNNTGNDNVAIGQDALNSSTGNGNIALGSNAGSNVTTADGVICIGHPGADLSNSCFIANIRGVQTGNADAIPVLIDSAGQFGTASSSARFKKEIKPMNTASEAILALNPVTFHYKSDKTDTPQFGLIAEEVANVNPDLVVRDKNGDIYTVLYDAVNAMLLNEFLKEHRKVEELKSAMAQQRNDFEAAIARQRKTTEAVVARLNEQEAHIQKVSAEVEARKPSSRMLVENQ